MSKLSVAFAINDAYTEYLSHAIYSLLKNNPENQFDIYVLCRKLTQANQQTIKNLAKYHSSTNIEIIQLKDRSDRFSDLKINIDHITIETYYRYILAEVLPDVTQVLYLDADILVTGDIGELSTIDIDEYYAAGVSDAYVAGVDKTGRYGGHSDYLQSIGFKEHDLYANAGVMVFNLDRMRQDDVVARLFKNTIRLANNIRFQDQDVINITMKGKIKELSSVYNYTDIAKRDDKKSIDEIKIIHYNGPVKPWENAEFAEFQKPFIAYYRQYVDEYNHRTYGSLDKFALYTSSTENIGDDIQAIAARRFLPKVDYYINRDDVGKWKNQNPDEHVKLIANGWYMHPPFQWPIQDSTIDALYVSMYVEQSYQPVVRRFLSAESRQIFKKAGRIGARDKVTHQFLVNNGIDAYVSGCVTLTLQRDHSIKKAEFILLTDVSMAVYEYVKRSTKRNVLYLTNAVATRLQSIQEREELAEIYLYLHQSAHCVITERLHSTLPCLAFETPVLLIKKDEPVGGNSSRFHGLGELANCSTEENLLRGDVYDIENPPKNPSTYQKYRKSLIRTCSTFTGFDNKESFSWSEIGKVPLESVLDKLNSIQVKSMRDATTALVHASYHEQAMDDDLHHKDNIIRQQRDEIDRLMGVKASARRLAGNIRRRISRGGRFHEK